MSAFWYTGWCIEQSWTKLSLHARDTCFFFIQLIWWVTLFLFHLFCEPACQDHAAQMGSTCVTRSVEKIRPTKASRGISTQNPFTLTFPAGSTKEYSIHISAKIFPVTNICTFKEAAQSGRSFHLKKWFCFINKLAYIHQTWCIISHAEPEGKRVKSNDEWLKGMWFCRI